MYLVLTHVDSKAPPSEMSVSIFHLLLDTVTGVEVDRPSDRPVATDAGGIVQSLDLK